MAFPDRTPEDRRPARDLRTRVVQAAEAALADHSYVSALDVLRGMRLLEQSHIDAWRRGQVDFLEQTIQSNLHKISSSMAMFREWARQKGLRPSETRYVRHTRGGTVDLRFSKSGEPEIEKGYRTHFVSPALSEEKQKRPQEKVDQAPEPVVFQVLRDSRCSECGAEIEKDDFLLMEAGQPLCLPCAGLGDLEFLPSGDTALTRRATEYSSQKAIVVRFSRARKHYERQGILVEAAAIEKAEQECTEDADERAVARARSAERRRAGDRALTARMAERIRALFPACPPAEASAIAAHTAQRGSGRVGRSAAGRSLQDQALQLAVVAAVRHRHTNYDELLASGVDRESARRRVEDRVDETLARWRSGVRT